MATVVGYVSTKIFRIYCILNVTYYLRLTFHKFQWIPVEINFINEATSYKLVLIKFLRGCHISLVGVKRLTMDTIFDKI